MPEIADDSDGKFALDLQTPVYQGGFQVHDPGSGLFTRLKSLLLFQLLGMFFGVQY